MVTLTSTTIRGWWWVGRGWRRRLRQAVRAAAPVGDFGFVDLVALVVGRRQAWRGADGTVDVDHAAADPADQMVMVVADAGFETSRGPGRLNPPDESFANQQAEGVVHRLERDGADLGPHNLGHAIGGDMRLDRDRPQDSQSLGGDLKTALTKQIRRVGHHRPAD
jgi:hypothetical protein